MKVKTKYPKHFLLIRDVLYDIGDGFSVKEDLDNVYSSLSFELPHINIGKFNTENLRKYDRVVLYYNDFDTPEKRNSATINDCYKIFDGYIDTTPLSESKVSGMNWNGLGCKSSLGLTYERTSTTPIYTADLKTIMIRALEETSIIDYIDYFEIDTEIRDSLIFNIKGDRFLGEIFDQIKDKYAVQVFQKPDSGLVFQFPSTFNKDVKNYTRYNSNGTVQSVSDTGEAWIYDLNSNCFSIDYGDLTQRVDTVIVFGLNVIGAAFDPITYQLKQGVRQEDLQPDIAPDATQLNALQIFRRDIFDEESAQKIAQETLIDLSKNYGISLEVMYNPLEKIGDRFVVLNSKKISPSQIWIIKSRDISISKMGASKCIIRGYSNSIRDIPSDILIGSSGLLDTDILNVTDRVVNTLELIR